jgi:arginine/lysine/ornithine decarboxylase
MDTPVYDFIKKYISENPVRLHMPGHKGRMMPAVPGLSDATKVVPSEAYDITEIDGADVLSEAEGIIAQSEENAGRLFNAHTLYSAEGSSLCIRAMLFLIKKKTETEGRKAYILAGRNVHSSFLSAAALLDLDVDFIMQREDESFESCTLTGKDIEQELEKAAKHKRIPDALYITSPDYLGNISDIKSVSEACHRYNVLFLVDNAHGAYLRFLDDPMHPMDLGADICCDSAHKTLPVLTGGAYLHISKNADEFFHKNAKQAMAVFATTSPSYLIMTSLDRCNAYLEDNKSIREAAKKVKELKERLKSIGFVQEGEEPLKITVRFDDNASDKEKCRPNGEELAFFLKTKGIYTEYHDREHVVMMFGPGNAEEDYVRTINAFEEYKNRYSDVISQKADTNGVRTAAHSMDIARKPAPERALSFREALFAESEEVDVRESIGRVLAEPLVHCPPCVPPYMLGEVIGKDIVKYCSGKIRVLKQAQDTRDIDK